MGAAQLVSALVLVTEGVLIGCGDLRYLLDVHCLNFVVLGGVLWWVGKTGAGLQGIWVAVFMNQALRMAQHAAHVWRGGGPDLFARNGDGEEDGER
jgi:Na+-driven multidrug efflux pump